MPTSNQLIDRYLGRTIGKQAPPAARTATECDCPPACPACGGLECLCRPRFFAGQVLTEDDLNRLENYVIAKNKLHNRYFYGSGVICGLEVVCDPCDPGAVTVKGGYALSPCGDDIIVCADAKADVCDLISRCKPRDDCDPYGAQPPVACQDGMQKWVLSICYEERFSRGVQPLVGEPCLCGGGRSVATCGCGGKPSGGCGGGPSCDCGAHGATTSRPKPMKATAQTYRPQCEPTLICEGFRFTASKYVDPRRTPSDFGQYGAWGLLATKAEQFGPLLLRLIACYLKAIEIRDAFAEIETNQSANDLALAHGEYLSLLREFAATHATHRCDLSRALDRVATPVPANADGRPIAVTSGEWKAAFGRLNDLWLEVFQDCVCSALLPPCPEAETSDCVPLAVVTIDVDACKVVEICNWTGRDFAVTLPALGYWTSFLHWGAIKDVIARLCCGTDASAWRVLFDMFDKMLRSNAGPVATSAGQPAVAAGVARPPAAAPGSATLLALSGFLQTAARPDGMARLLHAAQGAGGTEDVGDLRATLVELQKTVAAQGAEIARLSRNG